MKILHGIPASPGLAIGIAHTIRPAAPVDIMAQHSTTPAEEIARLEQAITQALACMEVLQQAAQGATADILAAQRAMMRDPELKQGAINLIQEGFTAAAAITREANNYAEQLASLPDEYLAAR